MYDYRKLQLQKIFTTIHGHQNIVLSLSPLDVTNGVAIIVVEIIPYGSYADSAIAAALALARSAAITINPRLTILARSSSEQTS